MFLDLKKSIVVLYEQSILVVIPTLNTKMLVFPNEFPKSSQEL